LYLPLIVGALALDLLLQFHPYTQHPTHQSEGEIY
jgi:hypothetical protein